MIFHPSNLPYWVLLSAGIVLFLTVIISGIGEHDADVDADMSADINVDAGVDLAVDNGSLHVDVDANDMSSPVQLLGWLGLGKAPLILLLATDLSLWGLLGWMLNVAVSSLLNTTTSGILAGVVLIGSLVISLTFGGFISRPLGQVFASFGEDASDDRVIGCIGTVSTARIPSILEGKIGQVDVIDPARNRITVNAALPPWATIAPQRGEQVLVIERSHQTYLVIAKDSPDQDHWLSNLSSS
ncbi:MAG: YqiJ family protein [Cyanobacteria bacterium]|nr:YqiJ family protein [Cyanobacteriota bacterium]MDW8202389.1 DUF1449 family protein [Cyanobacteriota bacterium SKYGB_h_bin112]